MLLLKQYALHITIASAATFLVGAWAAWVIIVRLPADYFIQPPTDRDIDRHTAIRTSLLIARNLLGIFFMLLGIAMLVLPGQGLLTLVLGLSLTNFPGKRAFEHWLLSRKTIRRSINWIRITARQSPMQFH